MMTESYYLLSLTRLTHHMLNYGERLCGTKCELSMRRRHGHGLDGDGVCVVLVKEAPVGATIHPGER